MIRNEIILLMDLFYLDMEYDVLLIQLDEDHEEVNELINSQFHLTKCEILLRKESLFKKQNLQ
jgi:hypothetical protein